MGFYQTFYPPAENSIAVRLRFLDSQRTGGGIETKKKTCWDNCFTGLIEQAVDNNTTLSSYSQIRSIWPE